MRRSLVLLLALLGFAAAQIGEPPAQLLAALPGPERLEGGRYRVDGVTFTLTPRGGALYEVTGEGTLDEAGVQRVSHLIGAATGYGQGIAEPLAQFLRERSGELAGQGEVFLNVEEFGLRLEVSGEPPFDVRFALALQEVPEDRFPEARHVLGPEDAPFVIREFSDFQCPFCARYAQTVLPQLKETLLERGDVRFEFHHLPLVSLHANAFAAAEAAECVTGANGPDAFWTYHDALLARQGVWAGLGDPQAYFVRLAREVGLASEGVAKCLEAGTHAQAVREAYRVATEVLGLNSTPSVFVNGYRLPAGAAGTLAGYERALARAAVFKEPPSGTP